MSSYPPPTDPSPPPAPFRRGAGSQDIPGFTPQQINTIMWVIVAGIVAVVLAIAGAALIGVYGLWLWLT